MESASHKLVEMGVGRGRPGANDAPVGAALAAALARVAYASCGGGGEASQPDFPLTAVPTSMTFGCQIRRAKKDNRKDLGRVSVALDHGILVLRQKKSARSRGHVKSSSQ